ncbi:hypothetical protein [Psychroserpens jangbogonensis]|uniref:hypothetical protein n=1 Tax=Psychroserpens jangbogonensis TaxID=1484460 RepID=UPI00053E85BD|nr:hypothetical protein [Psychroserpens jangbogonensis]
MKTNNNIQNEIDTIFDSVNHIKAVQASPFFKDKTLQRMFSEKLEEQQRVFTWFSPKLQLATLASVVVLNVFAITKLQESTYNENVSQFAESYGLSTSTETSLLN